MTKPCIRLFYLCCVLVFTLFTQSVSAQYHAKDFVLGDWFGYIKVDGKPLYRINVNAWEGDHKDFYCTYDYLPIGKEETGIQYDSIIVKLNERDTTASFELTIPNSGGGDCTARFVVKRANLYNQSINTSTKLKKGCGQVEFFLNSAEVMYKDSIFLAAVKVVEDRNRNMAKPDSTKAPSASAGKPELPSSPSTPLDKPAPTSISFTIDLKDITHPADKDFKWFDWAKAPKGLIDATRVIHTYKNRQTQKDVILYDDITNDVDLLKCNVRIAAIDLDDDGISGIAVESSGLNCCGTMGCSYNIYENGGLKITGLVTDHGTTPDKNRIKGSAGNFYTLIPNNSITVDASKIQGQFKYAKQKSTGSASTTAAVPANLLGGATPDELGRLMLKALQTNNKKLWGSCVHPTYDLAVDPERRERVTDQFDKIREDLEAKGISDWKKVSFSRIRADPCPQCAPPGEKWLTELVVEFWYQGHEFLGMFSFTPVFTYKGKYFVGRNYEHAMDRYSSR